MIRNGGAVTAAHSLVFEQIQQHSEFLSGRLGKLTRGKPLQVIGADLGGIKLAGQNLQRSVFQGCRFYCADLRGVDFSQASLTGCDFTGADLTDAKMIWANLRGADLSRAILKGAHFENADMRPLTEPPVQPHGHGGFVSLNESTLINTNLSEAKLLGASFVGATLNGAVFDNADLEGADFSYATLNDVRFRNSKLQGANFRLADMAPDVFEALTRSGARMPTPIEPHILDEALRLHQEWVESEGTAGRRANMVGWYLAHAYLPNANLSGADLRRANLANANLHGARLICTDVREANLMCANLTDADFRGCLSEGARGLPLTKG